MINISELITDKDFCQPSGIKITRYKNSILNHRVKETSQEITLQGIIIALDSNEDEMLEQSDMNKESITILTHERLKCVGEDKEDGEVYGSDIVHYKGANYIVRYCQDLSEYGYCRSKAIKIEQDVM